MEAKKNGRKGGIASGKARLAKKAAREYAIAALEGVIKDKDGVYHNQRYSVILVRFLMFLL